MDNSSNPQNGSGSDGNHRWPFVQGHSGRRRNPPRRSRPIAGSILTPRSSLDSWAAQLASLPSSDPQTSILIPEAPLHARPMAVNPQVASPLYSGRIPPEIRNQIFHYAMTEYTKSDRASQYPESTNYTRPGYTGKRAVAIALLLTCRRIYLETYHLPAKTKEHVFWHERWPKHHERYSAVPSGQEQVYFERFKPWQLELVKEIHLFTQLYWLEDGSFFSLTKQHFMQGIEKLRITIRRGDWWYNERNAPLGINPQRGNGDVRQMHLDWDAEKRGQRIAWRKDGWGCAFGNLQALKELEMEFETTEDKVVELDKIIEHAKTWRFPLKNGKALSTEGLEAMRSKWTGPFSLWSDLCPYCADYALCRFVSIPGTPCTERRNRRTAGMGPDCTVVILRWRVATEMS